jgi:hypothetical protein
MKSKPGTRPEIKPGDYIRIAGLTEEQFEKAVKAFEEAGYGIGDIELSCKEEFLGVHSSGDIYTFLNFVYFNGATNEITYAELVGKDKPIANDEQCGERSEHPHYELIEKYYREWGQWACYYGGSFMKDPVVWDGAGVYELRPRKKMMKIGDYEFPEPEREAPEVGTSYFVPDNSYEEMFDTFTWDGGSFDIRLLKARFVHLTKEAAIAHATAMILASGGKVDE